MMAFLVVAYILSFFDRQIVGILAGAGRTALSLM